MARAERLSCLQIKSQERRVFHTQRDFSPSARSFPSPVKHFLENKHVPCLPPQPPTPILLRSPLVLFHFPSQQNFQVGSLLSHLVFTLPLAPIPTASVNNCIMPNPIQASSSTLKCFLSFFSCFFVVAFSNCSGFFSFSVIYSSFTRSLKVGVTRTPSQDLLSIYTGSRSKFIQYHGFKYGLYVTLLHLYVQ